MEDEPFDDAKALRAGTSISSDALLGRARPAYEPITAERAADHPARAGPAGPAGGRACRSAIGALAFVSVVALAARGLGQRSEALRLRHKVSPLVLQSSDFNGKCLILEQDRDYLPSGPSEGDYGLDHIPEAGMCCAMCHGIPECKAWVWRNEQLEGNPYRCWILVNSPVSGVPSQGVVSGVPPMRPPMRLHRSDEGIAGLVQHLPFKLNLFGGSNEKQLPAPLAKGAGNEDRSKCALSGDNCWGSRCCRDPAERCHMKNELWAGCRKTCTPGIDTGDPPEAQQPWTCDDVTLEPGHVPVAANSAGLPPPPPAPQGVALQPVEAWQIPPPEEGAEEPQAPGSGTGPGVEGLTMFCLSLVQPEGYERGMVKAQYAMGSSIFACEGYAIYSNRVLKIDEGLYSVAVESSLKCQFHEIAWNTEIFIAVWRTVTKQGWYRSYDWTVKVDPDATFFPNRLRSVMRSHPNAGYMNNCKYGLHGPIEVLSLHALDALAWDFSQSTDGRRPHNCVTTYPQAIAGPAQWGEDMFLDYCLGQVLQLSRESDDRLMCEAHCDCPDWYWCHNDTARVTYHPFKREDLYTQCVANAMYGAPDAPP